MPAWLARCAVVSLVLVASLGTVSCGSGGVGTDAGTVAVQNLPTSTAAITRLDFGFFVISGLATRVELVDVPIGATQGFDFSEAEADNAFTLTVHWADATTTTYPLFGVSGGTTIGVAR
jgi:hypothetical protein